MELEEIIDYGKRMATKCLLIGMLNFSPFMIAGCENDNPAPNKEGTSVIQGNVESFELAGRDYTRIASKLAKVYAQSNYDGQCGVTINLEGIIKGAGVAEIINLEGIIKGATITANDGSFIFTKLPAGTYTLGFEYNGEEVMYRGKSGQVELIDIEDNQMIKIQGIRISGGQVNIGNVRVYNLDESGQPIINELPVSLVYRESNEANSNTMPELTPELPNLIDVYRINTNSWAYATTNILQELRTSLDFDTEQEAVDYITANRPPEKPEPAPISPDLRAYYRFDDDIGTITTDTIGNFNGTIIGGATLTDFTPFASGKSLYFDGVDDSIEIDGALTDNMPVGSIEAQVYLKSIGSYGNAVIFFNTTDFYFLVTGERANEAVSEKCGINAYSGAHLDLYSNARVPLNTWTKISTSWDGTNWYLHINDVLDTNRVSASVMPTGGGMIRIGDDPTMPGQEVHGYIDDIRISNTPRTE